MILGYSPDRKKKKKIKKNIKKKKKKEEKVKNIILNEQERWIDCMINQKKKHGIN